MSDVPIRAVLGLSPDDTVRAFEARADRRTTVRWSEMMHGEHARAFTVAKVAKLDLLETIRKSLEPVLNGGMTFEAWQAGLRPELEKAGWWGRVVDKELTGTGRPVLVGPRRLRTIYDTNLRMSRAAGQWARIQESKAVSPYLRYSAVMDARTRPAHRRWHGTILPVDHPWWDTHYPPCGWRCRCTVMQLSDADLESFGWQVSPAPPADGPGRLFYPSAPRGAPDPAPILVPAGIDPGFAYNPGKAGLAPVAEKAIASFEAAALGVGPKAADAVLREIVDSPAFDQFLGSPEGAWPIAVLDDAQAALIGAPSRVVVLPAAVVRKQQLPGRHPEMTPAEYRLLPDIVRDALVIIVQEGQRLIFFRSDGRLRKAVVRMDAGEPYAAVVSYHRVGEREIARDIRKGEVLLDRR